MRIALYAIIIFSLATGGFCDSGTDIKTFFQTHSDLFQEILKRYNDRANYKLKPIPGQKFVSMKPLFHKGPGSKKGTGPNDSTSLSAAPDPPKVYSSKSAWADLKATVTNYHTHYVIKVESSTPAEKWFLEKDDASHTVISSGGLNDQYNFVIDQPGNFVPGQVNLRVINISDSNQYPSLFPLK